MGDDCAIVEISALRPLNLTRHLSKNDAELFRAVDTQQTRIFVGCLEPGCESIFAESREGLAFGAGNYAQEGRKLSNWLNMLGRGGRRSG